jgi:coenzyme F420-dependent glucose-6-phosphate dehydrogenase
VTPIEEDHMTSTTTTSTGTTSTDLTLGYMLSSEEHPARDLVSFAHEAEEAGFGYAVISDHFHPWIDVQGESPFVWSVLGGIAARTERLQVGTAVTCPTMRYHPAIVAQAAATVATMMPGRFFLGVGTGEHLNEHVVGASWPRYPERAAMLEEAVEVIRGLWSGKTYEHDGAHYRVDRARVYSLPDEPPPIVVAAGGPKAAALAGRIGDGLMNYAPDPGVADAFAGAGGDGKPRYLQLNVCWAATEEEARRTAYQTVPTVALPGELGNLLPTPRHYEQAVELVTEDDIADVVVCGPDPERHLDAIRRAADAGYDHIHIDQVGPDQRGFFDFYRREILPALAS